ncbi:MAG: enoyl-CoA hydratase [Alphaproteobacteria bacterium]|nr:enoyl-CoA hydratase [Alphaproteobacteria bacterium]
MPTPNSPCFEVTIADRVAHIVLSRPEKLNSMIPEFWNDLPVIVRDIDRNAKARAIVISSTGKHFSSGMDLSVFTRPEGVTGGGKVDPYVRAEKFRSDIRNIQASFSCLEEARAPVIACIQGGAIGGAVDLVSACDFRFATRDAFFCIQEINIAMTADVGTFPRLCKLMPEGWVRQMAYTGERLPAARALQLGLVNDTFDTHEAMVAHALATAREIATKNPVAVTGSKVMINYARDHTTSDCLDYIGVWNAAMLAGPHMGEAFAAKAEKREPNFPDLLPLRDKAI